jgi:ATP-binding cassette subfamily B protein
MTAATPRTRRRLLVPEVVQTSAMDCGPAALTSLLAGFHVPVSYGRLREACQTDVDGTSIDTLEEIAVQLGLDAEQVMVPVDHLLLPEATALPAIVVVRQPNGLTHFVVAWRRHGRVVQVMDPGTGRRWPTCRRFLDELYVHTQPLPAAAWRAWAESDECLGALRRRWATLGLGGSEVEQALAAAVADPEWFPLAALDATTRLLTAMVHAGGLRRGQQATRVWTTFLARVSQEGPDRTHTVPAAYWMVRPAPPGAPTVTPTSSCVARCWCACAEGTRYPPRRLQRRRLCTVRPPHRSLLIWLRPCTTRRVDLASSSCACSRPMGCSPSVCWGSP